MQLNKVYVGNNLDVLKTFEDNSIDSIVTDPPYGLGKEPKAEEVLKDWLEHGYHEIKGKGFMGKEWDAFVPQPILWKECLRVLKPGGHLLSFAGTRTYDWIVMGLRLAGFEIRDQIAWLYGSGFPKSHDISKEEVVSLFPKTGPTKPHGGDGKKLDTQDMGWGFKRMPSKLEDNGGSASRFFYTAKASQSERNFGLSGFDDKVTTDGRNKSIDNAFNRGETKRKNIHPTVKPIDLMQYLVRLVTPKGGICLDPYLGSGTTAVACKSEKINYIGIELMPEYAKIAEARIKAETVQYDIFDFMEEA